MTQFHEGQEVEILAYLDTTEPEWQKAKIVREFLDGAAWEVQLPNGARAAFKPEHIRAALTRAEIAQDFLKHATLRKGERKKLERIAKGLP